MVQVCRMRAGLEKTGSSLPESGLIEVRSKTDSNLEGGSQIRCARRNDGTRCGEHCRHIGRPHYLASVFVLHSVLAQYLCCGPIRRVLAKQSMTVLV